MVITLTTDLEEFVRGKVRDGVFPTANAYIHDLVRERFLAEQDRTTKLRTLNEAIQQGLTEAEAGRVTPTKEAFARIRDGLKRPVAPNRA